MRLLVFPEAVLGGYPKGADFGAKVGSRSDPGRELFRRYWDAAVVCPGPETEQLAYISKRRLLHRLSRWQHSLARDPWMDFSLEQTSFDHWIVLRQCSGLLCLHTENRHST
jgi:hypothetical protein